MPTDYLFAAIAGYLLGSIPFGLILTRAFGAGDVRQIGSGSIGATNVLRTGRKGLAAATVLLDAGKGIAAVLLAAAAWPGSEGRGGGRRDRRALLPGLARLQGRQGLRHRGRRAARRWPGRSFLVCAAVWALALALGPDFLGRLAHGGDCGTRCRVGDGAGGYRRSR